MCMYIIYIYIYIYMCVCVCVCVCVWLIKYYRQSLSPYFCFYQISMKINFVSN